MGACYLLILVGRSMKTGRKSRSILKDVKTVAFVAMSMCALVRHLVCWRRCSAILLWWTVCSIRYRRLINRGGFERRVGAMRELQCLCVLSAFQLLLR